jgi:hypothetical protein
MACGGCAKRRTAARAKAKAKAEGDLMGGYKYLNARQLDARLDAYKRHYCKECADRYKCDYANYVKCRDSKKN